MKLGITPFGDIRSQAAVSSDTSQPIKLGGFYKPLNNLTATQMAAQLHTIIFTRDDEATVQAVKESGFTNPVLQYLRLDAIHGPAYIANSASSVCSSTQKSFEPRSNQVANEVGEFCLLHDRIVTKMAFDHDLNLHTSDVIPTENWFLHNISNQRLGDYSAGGFYYHMNPSNQHYREYFAARVKRELQGSATHTATGMDGIFLDNLELSWAKKSRSLDIKGRPLEFSSSATYVISWSECSSNLICRNGACVVP